MSGNGPPEGRGFVFWVGVAVSGAWTILAFVTAIDAHWGSPNLIGDAVAGAIAPIAVAWLVATVFLQQRELSVAIQELSRTVSELEASRDLQIRALDQQNLLQMPRIELLGLRWSDRAGRRRLLANLINNGTSAAYGVRFEGDGERTPRRLSRLNPGDEAELVVPGGGRESGFWLLRFHGETDVEYFHVLYCDLEQGVSPRGDLHRGGILRRNS